MANTQISITANGTKTLATAGKYCDRNIDVNVNVETAKPTQFTNLYDPANVQLKTVMSYTSGNEVMNYTSDNYVNVVRIPYQHKANEPVAIRVRGISCPVRDRQAYAVFIENGITAYTWGTLSNNIDVSYDEYGDMVMAFRSGSSVCKGEWNYLDLNFQYNGINSGASTALTGPIITINEPIGSIPYENTFAVTGIDADDVSHNWTMWGWKND